MKNALLTGKLNTRKSWEKQQVFDLPNGCSVTVGHSVHYGDMVQRIDDADGYWHCSNGQSTIPARFAFALAWIEPISPGHWETIMRPKFEKQF